MLGAEVAEDRWDLEGARKVIHLWVKDNGIGISPEDQQKIFQKFFRSEDQKAGEAPGTGLGLNITKVWSRCRADAFGSIVNFAREPLFILRYRLPRISQVMLFAVEDKIL